MKNRYSFIGLVLLTVAIMAGAGCHSDAGRDNPKDLLDRYFLSAIKQDYGTTYDCYYDAYRQKVGRSEYIRHRKEASALQSYTIASIKDNGDSAVAQVRLTFGPSEKLKRTRPVTKTVSEDLVRENGEWKIKVW